MSDEVKKGYVHKCGKSVKSWKRRWFVLKQNGYLYYYTDASANTEKGKIDVVEAKSVVPWSKSVKGAESPPSNMSASNAFCIVASDRVFTCVCEMEGESQSWINAMEKARGATDQKYPQPTYRKEGPTHTDAPLLVAPMIAPPPYTPSPTTPQPPPIQQAPQARPPSWAGVPTPGGAGYAGTQCYPPGQCWPQHQPAPMQANPPPPNYPPQQTYRPPQAYPPQAYPPRGNPPPQRYPPQPQGYAMQGRPQSYRPPPQGYPLPQGYPPRPNPPRPAPQYPPQAYPPRPPPVFPQYRPPQYAPRPVHCHTQLNTNVTVVNLAAPQQRHVIIRR